MIGFCFTVDFILFTIFLQLININGHLSCFNSRELYRLSFDLRGKKPLFSGSDDCYVFKTTFNIKIFS